MRLRTRQSGNQSGGDSEGGYGDTDTRRPSGANVKNLRPLDSETETETECETDGGYTADDNGPNKRHGKASVASEAAFENLQSISKWFPNAYKPPDTETESPEELLKRKRSEFWTRTRLTFLMFLSFLTVIACGHVWVLMLVVCIKVGMFKEILGLKRDREKDKRLPMFRLLNWYFFFICIYFVYGKILQQHIQVVHLATPAVGYITNQHSFKAFIAWTIGFCTFILLLEKGAYKYQFTQFGWTHVTLLMIVVSASSMVNNMYDGMIWFFVPVCLVIWNDVYAYVFGRFWGKTPLIKLSPKKTWEGFLGAFVTTVVFGFWIGHLMGQFDYMVCAQEELTLEFFQNLKCDRDPTFIPSIPVNVPEWLEKISGSLGIESLKLGKTVLLMPFMWDALNLSIFASLVAPFGGFFASGFKRAFKIKDFGDLIPGHGGITDRMDCQIIMSVFVAVYRTTFFLRNKHATVAQILSQVDSLSVDDKRELLSRLQAAVS